MAQKRRQSAGASLCDGFREDCSFVFAAEQRNTAMPVDESRERDAGCQTLDPGVGSTNSESSGQARSQGHAGPGHEAQGRHREMGSEESVEQSRGPVEKSDGDVTALLPPGGSPRRIALPVTATFRCRCATHVWKLHRRAWEHAVPSRAEERFDLSVAASSRCPLGGLHATSS
jgi:hypothetical protein